MMRCVCCGGGGSRRYRGCCARCYARHLAAVRAGLTTWALLEERGQTLPARPQSLGRAKYDRGDR